MGFVNSCKGINDTKNQLFITPIQREWCADIKKTHIYYALNVKGGAKV